MPLLEQEGRGRTSKLGGDASLKGETFHTPALIAAILAISQWYSSMSKESGSQLKDGQTVGDLGDRKQGLQ